MSLLSRSWSGSLRLSTPQIQHRTHSKTMSTLIRPQHRELFNAVASDQPPARVWSLYLNVMRMFGTQALSLDVHQEVLRKCTYSISQIRDIASRGLANGLAPSYIPHVHEARFQIVIRNIRAMHAEPCVNDYHFVLQHFASAGHHFGALNVLNEFTRLGLIPEQKTYGLCLQAIAHRMSLPISEKQRKYALHQCRKMTRELLAHMRRNGVQYSAVNFDLTLRIMKNTMDYKGLKALLQWCYGIDLDNPDCPPLDRESAAEVLSGPLELEAQEIPTIPDPLPFSTAALNSTLDVLGSLGKYSKMIQAFEVLTTPLPDVNQHRSSSFDDDGEDDFGVPVETSAKPMTPPYTTANTTTYNILIRHLSQLGQKILARHYMLQAFKHDRQTSHALYRALYREPLADITSPHFAVNRNMLNSVLGLANREKNKALMIFLATHLRRYLWKKNEDLRFLSRFRNGLMQRHVWPYGTAQWSNIIGPTRTPLTETPQEDDIRTRDNFPSIERVRSTVPNVWSVLDVDVAAQDPLPTKKVFDLDLHISIVRRNITEITRFKSNLDMTLGRARQHIKERMGRRVWQGKNVYFLTSGRRVVSKEAWAGLVKFKPRQPGEKVPMVPRRNLPGSTGFFTPSERPS